MAGQSITFDFLTTGADRTASGFRKVADNTVLAARGAKVLSDAIEKLGQKENRTAAESKILAAALRQTGDAEDRVAARAVLADAAIRRLDDAMQDSTKSSRELRKALGDLKINPGLVGPLLALAPAIATLGGVGAGVGAGLGGAFLAGGAALAAFGAIAKPILTDAKKAADAVGKAQDAYNVAIANGVAPAKAFKAEQLAIAKAYAGMSPAQIALAKQLGDMAGAWDKVKAAQAPVVTGALQPWLKSVTGLTSALGPIIAKIAPVIQDLGGQFNNLVNSSAFKGFRDFIGSTGAAAVSAGGSTIIDLIKSFMILLPQFDPLIREAVGWISRLGPAVLKWSSSKKASDQIQAFLQWFSQNGPVVGKFLKSIGEALAALAPGLAAGGTAELQAMTAFFGFVAKLPPGLAKPLAEVAGALLILNKLGVVSVGVKLLGLGGAGSAAGAAAGGAAAGGLWSKILPGARLVGGALVISLVITRLLQNPKNPKVLGNTDPNAPWNSWTSNQSLGGKAINAITALFHHATASILADFTAQGKAAAAAKSDVDTLTGAITHNGNASSQAHDARAKLLADMTKAGVDAATAQADVVRYSNAVQANGATSDQARGARQRLIGDILSAAGNARKGNTDLSAYTTAVQQHGVKSDQARGARQRLITDLVNSGTDAKTAAGLVDGLGRSITKLPSGKTIAIHVTGAGKWSVSGTTSQTGLAHGPQNIGAGPGGFAGGGYVALGSGPTADDVLIRASKGELVVPARMVRAGAVDHLRGAIPGFAQGGVAGSYGPAGVGGLAPWTTGRLNATATAIAQMTADETLAAMRAAADAARRAQANPFAGITGVPSGARISGSAQAAMNFAKSILWAYGWGQNQFPPLRDLWMGESGWNYLAYNASSGATGIPQSLPGSKMASAGADWRTNPATQIRWGLGYIKSVYGSPANAYGRWLGRSPHWYSEGGLVPGFASGGTVGQQGAAWLRAWQTRHGGGFGAAWGPTVLNQQIPEMAAAVRRAKALSGAAGLSPGQHRFWAAAAADETKRLAVLGKELTTERAWRTQLGVNELGLDRQIRAAGNLPSLAGPVRGWKAQLGRDKATVNAISRMLGYSDAYIRAHPAPKPPPKLPPVRHTYGGDVADNLGAVLASALGPFTGARAGALVMDTGGTLRPGFNPVWNGTGRPEPLVPARGGGGVHLHLTVNAPIGSQQQLEDWYVKTANKLAQHGRLTQAVRAAGR